jgi:hypothetical protein
MSVCWPRNAYSCSDGLNSLSILWWQFWWQLPLPESLPAQRDVGSTDIAFGPMFIGLPGHLWILPPSREIPPLGDSKSTAPKERGGSTPPFRTIIGTPLQDRPVMENWVLNRFGEKRATRPFSVRLRPGIYRWCRKIRSTTGYKLRSLPGIRTAQPAPDPFSPKRLSTPVLLTPLRLFRSLVI